MTYFISFKGGLWYGWSEWHNSNNSFLQIVSNNNFASSYTEVVSESNRRNKQTIDDPQSQRIMRYDLDCPNDIIIIFVSYEGCNFHLLPLFMLDTSRRDWFCIEVIILKWNQFIFIIAATGVIFLNYSEYF